MVIFCLMCHQIGSTLIIKLKIILNFGRGIAIRIFAGMFPRPRFSLTNSMGLFSCCLEISRFTHVMSRNHDLSDIFHNIKGGKIVCQAKSSSVRRKTLPWAFPQ